MSSERPFTKTRIIGAVALAAGCLSLLQILLTSYQRTQQSAVWELLDQWEKIQGRHSTEAKEVILELIQMQDISMPILQYALTQEETALNSIYRKLHQHLPDGIRQRFPTPSDSVKLQQIVLEQLPYLGPFTRPLVGAIAHELDTARSFEATSLLRSLYWSLPESQLAQHALANYLSSPHLSRGLFGSSDSVETWPHLGNLAPQVSRWLSHPTEAGEAAEALGLMGAAGAPYVKQIIEVATDGLAHTNQTGATQFSFLRTREIERHIGSAVMALGYLGDSRPSVLETLSNAWTHTNQVIRAQAAIAVQKLGADAAPIAHYLTETLDFTEAKVLTLQFQALSRIGPAAQDAVPQLRRFLTTKKEDLPQVPESRSLGWHSDEFNFLPLPWAAAYGLYGLGYGDDPVVQQLLSDILGRPMNLQHHKTRQLLDHLSPIQAQLIPLADGRLGDFTDPGTLLLAGNLLYLDQGHEVARERLIKAMENGSQQISHFAALQYFLATQDTKTVLPIFRRALLGIKGTNDQQVLQAVRHLGPTGRELADLITPMLYSEHPIVRKLAGKALRDIAPERLPAIAEN